MNIKRTFSTKQYELFKQICMLKDVELKKFMFKFLKQKGYTNIRQGKDFIMAEGDIPCLLLSHMDTVWPQPPSIIYFDREANVIWSPENGIGDDRAGVFAIADIINSGYKPHVILTLGEEIGGIGASEAAQLPKPFDIKYIVELDRRGENDCVFYSNANKVFQEYVESFGFVYNLGSFSDCETIGPAWNASYTNVSIGYLFEHQKNEHLMVDWLFGTIDKVKRMLAHIEEAPYFEYVPETYTYSSYYSRYGSESWWDDYDYIDEKTGQKYFDSYECICCGEYYDKAELIEVEDDRQVYDICPDCFEKLCNYCGNCGKPYIIPASTRDIGLCDDCIDMYNINFDEPESGVSVSGR